MLVLEAVGRSGEPLGGMQRVLPCSPLPLRSRAVRLAHSECPLLSALGAQLPLAELRDARWNCSGWLQPSPTPFPEKAASGATGETPVCLHSTPVVILQWVFFILCVLQKATSILDALVIITDRINVTLLFHFTSLLFTLQYDYEYDENGERVILGKGTYGVVYAGRDLSNQVRIAIKEIPERDSRYSNSG